MYNLKIHFEVTLDDNTGLKDKGDLVEFLKSDNSNVFLLNNGE